MTVLEKRKPSTDLIQMIKVAGDSLLSFGELWGTIKQKGEEEGFSEKELQEMLRPYLKQKMDSKKIWYLFNKEEEQERNRQNYQTRTFKQKIDEKKEPEQSPIQKETVVFPVKDSEQFYEEQEADKAEEEYLKETQINLTDPKGLIEKSVLTEENVFDWLAKRHDNTRCFYYDAYGTGLIKSRIIAGLEGSGIKTFKRLYFEV